MYGNASEYLAVDLRWVALGARQSVSEHRYLTQVTHGMCSAI